MRGNLFCPVLKAKREEKDASSLASYYNATLLSVAGRVWLGSFGGGAEESCLHVQPRLLSTIIAGQAAYYFI